MAFFYASFSAVSKICIVQIPNILKCHQIIDNRTQKIISPSGQTKTIRLCTTRFENILSCHSKKRYAVMN